MLRFLKDWTLPLAMLTGILGYVVLADVAWLAPVKPYAGVIADYLPPWLIFAQLLLTFCKVERLSELRPVVWHGWLLLFQLVMMLLVTAGLLCLPLSDAWRITFEAVMVCLICPTATAAAVITGKLGGNASTLTTYTLLSNMLAAIAVPLFFPLVEPHAGISFGAACFRILSKVFPLLILPFLLAWLFRYYWTALHRWLLRFHDAAFYLWALSLTIVTGQTTRSLINSEISIAEEIDIAIAILLVCILQFWLGKCVGGHYADRISGGQALGQKNTVLAIWMTYTYLNPVASVGPGTYVLWQNLFNSWQLWKRRNQQCRKRKDPVGQT
ncbi:MAG: bile acid:sodium symporter [Prevotellaceae bacterium]|jgi:BASS family bile acid:Na+ symporter|nr:bile acid:sodium symporter [Prevotellaceae bacterium]